MADNQAEGGQAEAAQAAQAVQANDGAQRNSSIPGIKPPKPFSTSGGAVADDWKIFRQRWENYTILSDLETRTRARQVALLLQCLDDDALKTYQGFKFDTPADSRTVKEIIDKFEAFAIGAVNVTYERSLFNECVQKDGQAFESFYSELNQLVKTCQFCGECENSLMRDRIVVGIRSTATRQELLRERELTLDRCVDMCRAAEQSMTQTKAMSTPETVHGVYEKPRKGPTLIQCKYCGSKHARDKAKCAAFGKNCSSCGKPNHFAKVCRSGAPSGGRKRSDSYRKAAKPKVHNVQEEDSSSEGEWVNAVTTPPSKDKEVKCELLVNKQPVTFQVDTGAMINTLPVRYATKIQPTTQTLRTWDDKKLVPIGVSRESVRNPRTSKKYSVEFVVSDDSLTPLIGLRASTQMKLVTVEYDNMKTVHSVAVEEEFRDVLSDDLGRLPGEHSLTVDPTAIPVIEPARRVPVALQSKLKEELERLTQRNVIIPVEEPTPWVSQMVVAEKKNGDLRVCIDPRHLNKALQREHYTLPVLDDVLHDLGQSRVFTKADLKSGYWHVVLDEESSKLTTFQTCGGRYRWLRLPFGLSVSAEIFQRKLMQNLSDLTGVVCIADDVVIHGRTQAEHDENLRQFLLRCRERNIQLNSSKLEMNTDCFTFMGHQITSSGVKMDPAKAHAITAMPEPTNVEELRRFLGMVNYVAKFLPSLATTIVPLHNLIKKDVPWV